MPHNQAIKFAHFVRPEDTQALKAAERRIKELERRLAAKEEEVIILKKAKRFFSGRHKNDTRS